MNSADLLAQSKINGSLVIISFTDNGAKKCQSGTEANDCFTAVQE